MQLHTFVRSTVAAAVALRGRVLFPLGPVLVACVLGCAGAVRVPQPSNGSYRVEIATHRHAYLDVVNLGSSQMTIYIVRNGGTTRIGRVRGTSEARFDLRQAAIGDVGMVQLTAHEFPFGRSYTSERMHVPMGRRIELRLETNLAMSSFAVR